MQSVTLGKLVAAHVDQVQSALSEPVAVTSCDQVQDGFDRAVHGSIEQVQEVQSLFVPDAKVDQVQSSVFSTVHSDTSDQVQAILGNPRIVASLDQAQLCAATPRIPVSLGQIQGIVPASVSPLELNQVQQLFSGVVEVCSTEPVPLTLTCRIFGSGTSADGDYPITFDPFLFEWSFVETLNGYLCAGGLTCGGKTAGIWDFTLGVGFPADLDATSYVSAPFVANFPLFGPGFSFCPGTFGVLIFAP